MLLRRISEHVRTQNWTAVSVDFVIVVLGVLFALTAEQWLTDQQQRSELRQAEIAINRDLLNNLFAAKEIVALAPCRKERTQILSDLLAQDDDHWEGIPWSPNPGAFQTRLPELLPTPYRYWGSRVWEAEQQMGTFSKMELERRHDLDTIFNGASVIRARQDEVFLAQSRLKTLAMERTISSADRTRYLDILHFHDQQAGLLERMAGQTLKEIEAVGFKRDDGYIGEFSAYMPDYLAERARRYGDCFVPFPMPFLKETTNPAD